MYLNLVVTTCLFMLGRIRTSWFGRLAFVCYIRYPFEAALQVLPSRSLDPEAAAFPVSVVPFVIFCPYPGRLVFWHMVKLAGAWVLKGFDVHSPGGKKQLQRFWEDPYNARRSGARAKTGQHGTRWNIMEQNIQNRCCLMMDL